MKITGKVLALCAFNVWGTSAFVVQAPKGYVNRASPLYSTPYDPSANVQTRLENLQGQSPAGGMTPAGSAGVSADSYVKIQGNSLKTWSFRSTAVERVDVQLKTDGRPLDADVELWQGPDNNPQKMRVYLEDGKLRPFQATIETPRGPNTVAIRNVGQMEFPLAGAVAAANGAVGHLAESSGATVQGGAIRTQAFESSVESVQIVLKTDGRPLNARIELLQGPNNNKQVIEIYCEDGLERPFAAIIETPGSGNVVRIVNTSTMEFPLSASADPYKINTEYSDLDPVITDG